MEVSTISTQQSVFKRSVMHKLIDKGENVDWLCKQVTEKTGLFCDSSYLSKIFRGERKAEKIVNAVKEILE